MKHEINQGLLSDNGEKRRKIYILRHGETALNVTDRIRGWSDVPLDDKGVAQAIKMGKKLRDSDLTMLIASDLTRTLQTARNVSEESGKPVVHATQILRPWNVGKYTGHPASEVHPILLKMATETPEENIPEGESFESFKNRVLMGIIAFLNQYPHEIIGFVVHHRNDRIVRAWYEAGCPSDFEVDLAHFNQKGIEPGTFDVLEIKSNLLK